MAPVDTIGEASFSDVIGALADRASHSRRCGLDLNQRGALVLAGFRATTLVKNVGGAEITLIPGTTREEIGFIVDAAQAKGEGDNIRIAALERRRRRPDGRPGRNRSLVFYDTSRVKEALIDHASQST